MKRFAVIISYYYGKEEDFGQLRVRLSDYYHGHKLMGVGKVWNLELDDACTCVKIKDDLMDCAKQDIKGTWLEGTCPVGIYVAQIKDYAGHLLA